MERRELFSSLASKLKGESPIQKKSEKVIRPPYFGDDSLFHKECPSCDAPCVTVCEEDIIKIAEDKTPYLSFDLSGCTFCDECAIACEPNVLDIEERTDVHINVLIDPHACLAWNQTICTACKEPCLDDAILFQGLFKPVIDMDQCTGCGFCIGRCPTAAIKVEVLG